MPLLEYEDTEDVKQQHASCEAQFDERRARNCILRNVPVEKYRCNEQHSYKDEDDLELSSVMMVHNTHALLW